MHFLKYIISLLRHSRLRPLYALLRTFSWWRKMNELPEREVLEKDLNGRQFYPAENYYTSEVLIYSGGSFSEKLLSKKVEVNPTMAWTLENASFDIQNLSVTTSSGILKFLSPWMCYQNYHLGQVVPQFQKARAEFEDVILFMVPLPHYYHVMLDLFPQIELAVKNKLHNESTKWMLPLPKTAYQKEIYQKTGIDFNRIEDPWEVSSFKAKKLTVFSVPSPSAATFKAIRGAFLTESALTDKPKKIYFTRRGARVRRLLQESEVMDILSSRGYQCIDSEGLTVSEQASLTSSAEYIVAAHGSSSTNLVFCKSGAQLLEIVDEKYFRNSEDYEKVRRLTSIQGVKHYCIPADGVASPNEPHPHSHFRDLKIDLKDFEKAVDLFEKKTA